MTQPIPRQHRIHAEYSIKERPPVRPQPDSHHTPALISTNPATPNVAADQLRAFLHELGNLIDGSLRSVSLAQHDLERAPTAPAALDDANRHLATAGMALQHINGLINTLAPDSAITTQRALHNPPPPLATAISNAINLVQPLAVQRAIEISSDIQPGGTATHPTPIFPALLNALRNSIEAIDYGGTIHIHATLNPQATHIVVQILDDGPGPTNSNSPD